MSNESELKIQPSLAAPFGVDLRGWLALGAGAGFLVNALRQAPIPFSGLGAVILMIAVWLMLYRVGSEELLAQSRGNDRQRFIASDGLAVRHIGLWLLATLVLVALTVNFGPLGTVAGCAVLAMILPAATIVLTLIGSLVEALVPTQWLRLIRRLGLGDYLRLCATLFAAGLVYMALNLAVLYVGLGAVLRGALLFGFWAWMVLAWFHLAGRAVWLHRAELGLDDVDIEPDSEPERFTRDPEALWREVIDHGGTQAMHTELIRQLERSGNRERLLQHARIHIPALLLAFEDEDGALERATRMLELDRDFALTEPDTMFKLIQAAATRNHRALTGRLAASFLGAFRSSLKRNEVRLLACEALAESGSSERKRAEQWYRELMTAELTDEQRERVKKLAPAYL